MAEYHIVYRERQHDGEPNFQWGIVLKHLLAKHRDHIGFWIAESDELDSEYCEEEIWIEYCQEYPPMGIEQLFIMREDQSDCKFHYCNDDNLPAFIAKIEKAAELLRFHSLAKGQR